MAIEIFDILTFDHDEVENIDITTTDPDWTDVLTLTTPNREAGVYGLVFALQFTLNSTSQAFMYRFSLDGGSSWGPIYEKEVKDRSNIEIIEAVDVIDHTGGVIDLRVQCTRAGTATCTVLKAFISCERKG